jgi:hypothetical protein
MPGGWAVVAHENGDTDEHRKQQCVIEFMDAGNAAPTEIQGCVKNVYENMTVDVSTVMQWVKAHAKIRPSLHCSDSRKWREWLN